MTLNKSSVSIRPLILQAMCAVRFTSKNNVVNIVFPEVWELERLQTAKVTFIVTQGHCYWCYL